MINDLVKEAHENSVKHGFWEKNKNFGEVFRELFGGGKAELILTDEQNILECGIEIQAQPTGKKDQKVTITATDTGAEIDVVLTKPNTSK